MKKQLIRTSITAERADNQEAESLIAENHEKPPPSKIAFDIQ
jgi:hypothetical protein